MLRLAGCKRAVGLLAGLIMVLGACSSGGSSALSKDEFLKQGNAICKDGNAKIDSVASSAFGDSSSQPDPATMKKFIDETLVPNVKAQVDAIDKLKPPKELESGVKKLVADARAALTKLQQQAATDPAAVFNGADPFADINKEAASIGLDVCAAGSNNSSSS